MILVAPIIQSCGRGGGGRGAVSTPAPAPARIALVPVPAGDYVEKVTLATSQSYYDVHPDLTTRATQLITDANAFIAKDPQNKKRYVLGPIMTYASAADLSGILTNPNYLRASDKMSVQLIVRKLWISSM